MTNNERETLVEQIVFVSWKARLLPGSDHDAARDILAAIEPAIRADERKRVVAGATTNEAVERAVDSYDQARRTSYSRKNEPAMSGENKRNIAPMISAAIRAALTPDPPSTP